MVITEFRTDLPAWAKSAMSTRCMYCGAYIVDNSDTGSTTARWCLNPKCPGHMAHKAVVLAKFFKRTGLGEKTLLASISLHNYSSHFDFIPVWFKDNKPLVTLPELATLACLEGYGETTARQELSPYASFTDYFNSCPNPNPILSEHKEELLYAENLFVIKPPLAKRKMLVMGTGSFHNYSNRGEYFRLINEAFGSVINVIETGKRKTGVSYLIKEKDAVDHSKSRIAREQGIPVVTPDEFLSIISSLCLYESN